MSLHAPGRVFPWTRGSLIEEYSMPEWAKKIIWTLVVCFIIYYIVTQPEQFAYGVKSIVHSVARIFHALSH